jgi:hypothetical protein
MKTTNNSLALSLDDNTLPVTEQLASLEAIKSALMEKVKQAKSLQEHSAWETATKRRNPQLVLGSLRPATDQDAMVLGHAHGWVCEIQCGTCGVKRLINKQDAFQVKFCVAHKAEARKIKAKAAREAIKAAGMTPDKLAEQIALLQSQLIALQG